MYVYGLFWGQYLGLDETIELTQDAVDEADGFVAHYDENGHIVKALHATGPGRQSIQALALDQSGDVYIAGKYSTDMVVLGTDTLHAGGKNNMFVARYSTTSLSSESSAETPTAVIQGSNYPNPFSDETTITYSLPVTGNVRLAVYDILGRELSVLVDERPSAGRHSARLDASTWPDGIYVYRLEAGEQFTTGSLVHRK